MPVIKGADGRVLLFTGRRALLATVAPTSPTTGGGATTPKPTPVVAVTAITLSPASGTANSATGTIIGSLTATVTNGPLVSPVWTLTSTAGGDFQIVNGNQVAVLPGNVPAGSYSITAQVAASNLSAPFSQAMTVTMAAAQSSGTTTPPTTGNGNTQTATFAAVASKTPLPYSIPVTNWGSVSSPVLLKRRLKFSKGHVPSGSVPTVSPGSAQFYAPSRRRDGSLKSIKMVLTDANLAAGATRSYSVNMTSGSLPVTATRTNGNAGLASALSAHDIVVTVSNAKNSSNATYNGGTLTASLRTLAGMATRWEVLCNSATVRVWKGWGFFKASGSDDAHLKLYATITEIRNNDGSQRGLRLGLVLSQDAWNTAGKDALSYDAVLTDNGTTVLSYLGVRHHYHGQWLLCINDQGNNAGEVPWVGCAQPTLFAAEDQAYALGTNMHQWLRVPASPGAVATPVYTPLGSMDHRAALDQGGEYPGRGMVTRFDAIAFQRNDAQSFATARVEALAGMGVQFHYKSTRQRTRPGEAADISSSTIALKMAPKPDSYSDFTADGLPVAVNGYIRTAGTIYPADTCTDNFVGASGGTGPWGTTIDCSHAVSYCYWIALITGDEWFEEAELDLAMNTMHIWGYGEAQYTGLMQAAFPAGAGGPQDKWTALTGQVARDNVRSIGWANLIAGQGFSLVADDDYRYRYVQALITHNGDWIGASLDNSPSEYEAGGIYYPPNDLVACGSPWMVSFIAQGMYVHWLLNEDERYARAARRAAQFAKRTAAAGQFYPWDMFRNIDRRLALQDWNATSNPIIPAEKQGIPINVLIDSSTDLVTIQPYFEWNALDQMAPSFQNGDPIFFTAATQFTQRRAIPPEVTEGTTYYIRDLTNGVSHKGAWQPISFKISPTVNGSPVVFQNSVGAPDDSTNAPNGAGISWRPADTTALAGTSTLYDFPYLINWSNYIAIHAATILTGRQAGDPDVTDKMVSDTLAFLAPARPSVNYAPVDIVPP